MNIQQQPETLENNLIPTTANKKVEQSCSLIFSKLFLIVQIVAFIVFSAQTFEDEQYGLLTACICFMGICIMGVIGYSQINVPLVQAFLILSASQCGVLFLYLIVAFAADYEINLYVAIEFGWTLFAIVIFYYPAFNNTRQISQTQPQKSKSVSQCPQIFSVGYLTIMMIACFFYIMYEIQEEQFGWMFEGFFLIFISFLGLLGYAGNYINIVKAFLFLCFAQLSFMNCIWLLIVFSLDYESGLSDIFYIILGTTLTTVLTYILAFFPAYKNMKTQNKKNQASKQDPEHQEYESLLVNIFQQNQQQLLQQQQPQVFVQNNQNGLAYPVLLQVQQQPSQQQKYVYPPQHPQQIVYQGNCVPINNLLQQQQVTLPGNNQNVQQQVQQHTAQGCQQQKQLELNAQSTNLQESRYPTFDSPPNNNRL